jgi:hypothetical protein
MIPVAVLTGFLGSGKTTLLARLLRSPQFSRTAASPSYDRPRPPDPLPIADDLAIGAARAKGARSRNRGRHICGNLWSRCRHAFIVRNIQDAPFRGARGIVCGAAPTAGRLLRGDNAFGKIWQGIAPLPAQCDKPTRISF